MPNGPHTIQPTPRLCVLANSSNLKCYANEHCIFQRKHMCGSEVPVVSWTGAKAGSTRPRVGEKVSGGRAGSEEIEDTKST